MHGRSVNKDNSCSISRIYQCFGHDYRLVAKNECRHLTRCAKNSCLRAFTSAARDRKVNKDSCHCFFEYDQSIGHA